MPLRWSRKRMLTTILVTFVLTALAVVIGLNFVTPTKQLERKIEHRYAVSDPQFRREMSVMLGPAILPGNRVTDLQNGAEIFPAMLEAIASAKETVTSRPTYTGRARSASVSPTRCPSAPRPGWRSTSPSTGPAASAWRTG